MQPQILLRLLPALALSRGVAAAACNGHEELCARRYADVTLIGAHNSAFVGETPAHNQFVTPTAQLNRGVRFLQLQTHDLGGTIELCHTNCWELDAGPLTSFLRELAAWMGEHPEEVVTLMLTNIDAIPVRDFDAAFERAGLKQLVYRTPGGGRLEKAQWPTLRELIAAGTRVIVFMDAHSDVSKVDYILPEFDYFWETPYGITDKKFPTCAVDRPSGGDAAKLMGIMNHMLNYRLFGIVFPDVIDAGTTNSLASIQAQVALCRSQGKPQPNVVLLDWVDIGDAPKAHLVLNGLS